MLDSSLRSKYQTLFLDPCLKLSVLQKTSPSQITALGCLFGLLFLPLLLMKMAVLASLALVISGYLDTLDGALARKRNLTSPLGTVFDIVSDRLVEFIVVLALFLASPQERALPALCMLGSILLCVTSFLVVGIFTENSSEKSFHYSPGLMERAEAFIFFIAMALLPSLFTPLAYFFTILVLYTTLRRLLEFRRSTRVTVK